MNERHWLIKPIRRSFFIQIKASQILIRSIRPPKDIDSVTMICYTVSSLIKEVKLSDQKYECPYCHATGIYRGGMEPSGIGVICNVCQGKGWVISSGAVNTPLFTERKIRRDTIWVCLEISRIRGKYIGEGVSVDDFYKGIMPTK